MTIGRSWDLPVSVHRAYIHAWGLRLRGSVTPLAIARRTILPSPQSHKVGTRIRLFRSSIALPACPLSTLRRPPHREPTHDSGPWLVANHYLVGDLHSLPFADFYRRFRLSPPALCRLSPALSAPLVHLPSYVPILNFGEPPFMFYNRVLYKLHPILHENSRVL